MTSNMTPDQASALRALVTYLTDAMTTVGEVDPNQAAHITNLLRTFDPTDADLVPMFRDALVGLPVATPDPDEDNGDAACIRELTEYADALGVTPVDLLMALADDTKTIGLGVDTQTRAILRRWYSDVSDSLIEDLLEDLIDVDDDAI